MNPDDILDSINIDYSLALQNLVREACSTQHQQQLHLILLEFSKLKMGKGQTGKKT